MTELIPFVDLKAQYRRYQTEIDAAMQDILQNAAFVGGAALKRFEAAFADFCGTKHCVGVGNGTDALYLALRALGVGAGDEVITAANTFIATGEAISMTGATPVFVDINDDTALMEAPAVEAAMTSKTRAVIPVHLYGQLIDMEPLLDLCAGKGIHIIEDAAQAHGAEFNKKRAGSYGNLGCFSFYPGKNLGAYGDAGAVVGNDEDVLKNIRMLANHGRADKFGHIMEGVNSRLDGLQAAVLEVKLRHLATWTAERQAAAKRYDELLADIPQVRLPTVKVEGGHVFHLYVIRIPDRDRVRTALSEANIQSGIHYPIVLPRLPAYNHLNLGSFPVAEAMSQEILSLPISPEITASQQERVASVLRSALA